MAKRSGLGRGVEAFYGGIGSIAAKKEDVTAKIEPEEKKADVKKSADKKSEKGVKADKTVESVKTEKAGKPVTSEKTEKAGKPVASEKTEKAGKPVASGKTEKPDKTIRPERSEKSEDAKGAKGKAEKVSSPKALGSKNTDIKTEKAVSSEKVTTAAAAEETTEPANESSDGGYSGGHALEPRDSDAVAMVKLTRIEPNRDQPRKDFDEEGLQELAESLRNLGVIQPILVRPKGDFYEIVAGERRWRAARMAGMKEVPVIIRREYTDADVAEIALVENLQRKDLNPIEEARAYQQLIDVYHLTQEEVAFRVSKKRTSITNSLRLLKLHPSVQEMLQDGTISMGHAKVLLSLDTLDQQLMVALMVAQDDLSVRQTEQKVHEILNPKSEKVKKTLPDQLIYQDLENRLGSSVNSKVVIHRTNTKKGKIEISYTSLEELERIAELLGVKM